MYNLIPHFPEDLLKDMSTRHQWTLTCRLHTTLKFIEDNYKVFMIIHHKGFECFAEQCINTKDMDMIITLVKTAIMIDNNQPYT